MLMMEGGGVLALMRFWRAIKPPKVVVVPAQAAITMAALGAEALAHSASRMASALSGKKVPGAPQLLAGVAGGAGGGACVEGAEVEAERGKALGGGLQSEELETSESS